MSFRIPILDSTPEHIGCLSAFSPATLSSSALIELIRSWRHEYRQFFFTQFEETTKRTLDYVRTILADETRLMFFIYANSLDDPLDPFSALPVGHIGVTHLDQPTIELDNMIRGRAGGNRHLMYWAEVALLRWAFRARPDRPDPATKALCRLLDDNWRTIRHHSRVGFRMVRTIPLMRWEAAGEIHLQPYVDGMTSGELIDTPQLGEMELTAEDFFGLLREQAGKGTKL